MILRRWRGAVRPEDVEADLVEVVMLSLRESMDDVRSFAG